MDNDRSGSPTGDQRLALWREIEARRIERNLRLPTEQAAINAMFEAHERLRDFGWRDIIYCPKDGTVFQVIETGSTGIFDCYYSGEWPDGCWNVMDANDVYPSSKGPTLFRLKRAETPDRSEPTQPSHKP